MLSLAETIALLRSVSLFADAPDEKLEDIAAILKPLDFGPEETVVSKGDRGDCMYVIVSGRVRVHDGERFLNYLTAADVFGEMALFDSQPRVASVTTTEPTQVLRLDQVPFFDLMASQFDVSLGVIRVLSRHLRARVNDMAQDYQYLQAMSRLAAAAAALEAGRYDARSLEEIVQRTDSLGQLARVFSRMASEVQAREERLKREVQQLRIEIDQTKKAQQVEEVTNSEYFQELRKSVKMLRSKRREETTEEPTSTTE